MRRRVVGRKVRQLPGARVNANIPWGRGVEPVDADAEASGSGSRHARELKRGRLKKKTAGILWPMLRPRKGWTTRTFILEKGRLSYYKHVGAVDKLLFYEELADKAQIQKVGDNGCDLTMHAADGERQLLITMRATTPAERDEWFEALGGAVVHADEAPQTRAVVLYSGERAMVPHEAEIFRAIRAKDEITLKRLLRGASAISARDVEGRSPLRYAVQRGDLACVEALLNFGHCAFDGDAQDRSVLASASPAIRAAVMKYEKNITDTLYQGTDAHALDKLVELEREEMCRTFTAHDGRTPLHFTALTGKEKSTRFLLDTGIDPNVADANGSTPMHAAAESLEHRILEMLLEPRLGADPNCRNAKGLTPMHVVTIHAAKNTTSAELCIRALATHRDTRMDEQDLYEDGATLNRTCLHIAAEENLLPVARLLLKFDTNGRAAATKDRLNRNPLQVAQERHEISSSNNRPPPHGRAACTLQNCAKSLLQNHDQTMKFFRAAEAGDIRRLEQIYRKEEQIGSGGERLVERTDNRGRSALFVAVENDQAESVSTLVRWGADPHKCSENGRTPKDRAEQLFSTTPSHPILASLSAGQGAGTLFARIRRGDERQVRYILEDGLKQAWKTQDEHGNSALFVALFFDRAPIFRMLLDKEVQAEGVTPVQISKRSQFTTDATLRDFTLLHLCCAFNRTRCLRELIKFFVQAPSASAPLPGTAATATDSERAGSSALIKWSRAPWAQHKAGRSESALHKAALFGNVECVSLLLGSGHEVQADKFKYTPREYAVVMKERRLGRRMRDHAVLPAGEGTDLQHPYQGDDVPSCDDLHRRNYDGCVAVLDDLEKWEECRVAQGRSIDDIKAILESDPPPLPGDKDKEDFDKATSKPLDAAGSPVDVDAVICAAMKGDEGVMARLLDEKVNARLDVNTVHPASLNSVKGNPIKVFMGALHYAALMADARMAGADTDESKSADDDDEESKTAFAPDDDEGE
eukprot:g994.t1